MSYLATSGKENALIAGTLKVPPCQMIINNKLGMGDNAIETKVYALSISRGAKNFSSHSLCTTLTHPKTIRPTHAT